jgi:glycosyltransferase involved in cell wall biosynthesis
VNLFLWHVHGAWTTGLVQGPHTYLVPVLPERGPDGRGRAQTYIWPGSVVEVTPEEARRADVDVVLLQRPAELDGLAAAWLGGRRPGVDLPAVYVEHNAPQGEVNRMRHPAADREDLTLVHVTHFNRLFWDGGGTPTAVIEHGIVDPGPLYSGELERTAVCINQPGRRARVVGDDLLTPLGRPMPVDLFGIDTGNDLSQADLHVRMARRRAYLHPYRWTSLGLSLLEAMHLAMPVVALATTEVPEAVGDAGIVSNRLDRLADGLQWLRHEPEAARALGRKARRRALDRYSLDRFLADWDRLLAQVAGRRVAA